MTESVDESVVPAAAGLVRDFVNTHEPQVAAEALSSPQELEAWFDARGLLPPGNRLGSSDLAAALALREGLRQILLGHAGHDSDAGSLAALDATLAELPMRLLVTAEGLRLLPANDVPRVRTFASIIDAIRECEKDRTWTRLKVCARDTCRWAFYDASRNQTRRWCSMAGCGNHVKMRRAYATRRDRALSSTAPRTQPPT
ncbi:CGNR zinc finger domain-containing protein [Blastococcus haudaquaticus]|uniref:Conserved protein containing a Zn-ribbon-like motif, possibly RNA-binding n=1 Tax=Blastococcus haudaquaticus TaxID=1938745 RepID=A0A286H473_9ACTN|nr:CGNR zinc finger domain-containing protein [Blastococcus haudaquaticus]SOE02266.1 Conserved protein containing a Zn-ribbon-like motif, possibly RNA-binding [Blastococcus haudaquaticus]